MQPVAEVLHDYSLNTNLHAFDGLFKNELFRSSKSSFNFQEMHNRRQLRL